MEGLDEEIVGDGGSPIERGFPLPFVCRSSVSNKWILWDPEISNDFETDFCLGSFYAELTIQAARESNSGGLFVAKIMGEVIRRPELRPVELGFISRIINLAYVGSLN